jgi:serine/threonine protein kinase
MPTVPDHDLLRLVARGAYGEVWLARNVLGTFRAVKIVHRASFDSDRPYDREFNGLQKFEPLSRSHPGLVNILHVGRNIAEGYFYSVMEAADDQATGQTFSPENYRPRTLASELSGRGRLPVELCIHLGIALADGLGHLHSHELVHRDVKPSNIIYVGGSPKLADIGLVTQIAPKATFVGTEGYLAPEGPGSPSADLYALGRVLYEAAMGKSQDHFPELPTRLREFPDAPGLLKLNSIILKACDFQHARRFASAHDFSEALTELRPKPLRAEQLNGSMAGLNILLLAYGPDGASLAGAVSKLCADDGASLVHDEASALNVEWARRLEQRIQTADVILPILASSLIHNEFLAYAFEVVRQARISRSVRLIPVWLGRESALPGQLALALDSCASAAKVSLNFLPIKKPDETAQEIMNLLHRAPTTMP